MLAEMFMIRLETMRQNSKESGGTDSDGRFIPFRDTAVFAFKDKRQAKP
jgi:hypothetical protein